MSEVFAIELLEPIQANRTKSFSAYSWQRPAQPVAAPQPTGIIKFSPQIYRIPDGKIGATFIGPATDAPKRHLGRPHLEYHPDDAAKFGILFLDATHYLFKLVNSSDLQSFIRHYKTSFPHAPIKNEPSFGLGLR